MIQTGKSARHTFGSDPDAVGWPGLARNKDAEATPTQPVGLPPRPIWWLAARERAAELEGEQGRVFTRLLAHVEEGWVMAVELAALADDCTPPPQPEPALHAEVMSGVLAFLKIEVVDLFTGLALASAMMLPTPGTNQRQSPDPDEIERLGERFSRNVLILQLAAAHPIIPEVVRDPLRRVCRNLLDWYPDYSALAVAAARLIRSAG